MRAGPTPGIIVHYLTIGRTMRSSGTPQPIGLFDPAYERDACGTGFVASIDGVATHAIVKAAIQCVCNVTHRGAVSADAKTGDGAGILTQLPHGVFAKVLKELKAKPVGPCDLGVGVIFLPQDAAHSAAAQRVVEETIAAGRLQLIGWRDAPVDPSALGDKARATLPVIRHVLVSRPAEVPQHEFERRLFLIRRRIEKAWEQARAADCYIPS